MLSPIVLAKIFCIRFWSSVKVGSTETKLPPRRVFSLTNWSVLPPCDHLDDELLVLAQYRSRHIDKVRALAEFVRNVASMTEPFTCPSDVLWRMVNAYVLDVREMVKNVSSATADIQYFRTIIRFM